MRKGFGKRDEKWQRTRQQLNLMTPGPKGAKYPRYRVKKKELDSSCRGQEQLSESWLSIITSMSHALNSRNALKSRWLPWPKRIDICLLSFVAMVIAYCDRVNLSVTAPLIMQEYHWDTAQMGWALSGFFMGYTIFMIPAGRLVDHLGPQRVFAASVAWWSIFTAFAPLPRSVTGLTVMRAVMGTGQSGTIPSINRSLVSWFPRQEYSRAFGFSYSGGFAGPILAFPLASALLHAFGWRSVFFIFAILGWLWLPFWLKGVSDRPESSPPSGNLN